MTGREAMDVDAALDNPADPIGQASAYQDMMLGLVGDRDPAEIQAQLPDDLEAVMAEAGPHLRTRPAPGEWSVLELLGHLLDAEIVYAARYRWILAHDEPPLIGYDQDLWVDRLRHREDDQEEMLELLRTLRRSHLRLWAEASESDRARVGIHAERGPESFDLSFRMLAGHGLFHLAQMRRTLAQVSGS